MATYLDKSSGGVIVVKVFTVSDALLVGEEFWMFVEVHVKCDVIKTCEAVQKEFVIFFL